MAAEQRVYVNFSSTEFDDISPNLFQVVGFDGTEAISELFHYEIDLISDEPDIDLKSLIGKAASLEISRDEKVRNVRGIISHLQQGEELAFHKYSYKAVLVPRMWLMSLSRQNQIHQEQTVSQIVEHEMTQGDYSGGMLKDDLEFRICNTYPVREYTVQYKESDLNFVSRLLEHYGIYYYFEHSQAQERVVFCDENNQLDSVETENTVSYVPPSGLASFNDQAIHSFKLKQQQISKEFLLKDYNYRKPELNLQGLADSDDLRSSTLQSAEGSDLSYGRVCDYGDHFKQPADGLMLAKMRAQMALCNEQSCHGSSDALLFEAGKLMAMEDHYHERLNREYLLTKVRHRGGQALPGVSASAVTGEAIAYQNDFEAIPSEVAFRPALKAHKPKLYGILTAKVDGAVDSDRAQIDEEGRYKLVMPFDISGAGEGKATRWVRKAESYGGQGTGMHFPLLKGSEVIWSCIDGDPDRPIITGVVANPLNKSVVSAANSTRNVIKTPGGMVMTMDDGAPSSEDSSSSDTQQQQTRIGQNVPKTFSAVSLQAERELIHQQQHTGAATTTEKVGVDEGSTTNPTTNITTANANTDGLEAGQKMYSMLVENYDGPNKSSYFRMGYPDLSTWEEQAGTAGDDKGAGILMATHGSIKQKSYKNFFSQTSGISFKQDLSNSGSYSRGYAAAIKLAGSTNVNATFDYTTALGFNTKFTIGTDVSVNYGIKFSSGSTKEYKNVSGPLVQQAKDVLIRASNFDGETKTIDKLIGGGTVLAGIGAVGTTIAAVPGEAGTWSDSSINEKLLLASGVSSAATVAGSVAYALRKIKHEADELKKSAGTESFIALDNDSIVLSCDGSSIIINAEGIFINGKTLATGQLPGGAAIKSFAPNNGDLKDAKVGKIHPEFINLNATKRVDIRSKDALYLATNKNFKMKDELVPVGEGPEKAKIEAEIKRKMKANILPPPPPDVGVLLFQDAKGNFTPFAEKNCVVTAKKSLKFEASGTFDVTTKDAKFSKNVTVKGTMSDKNLKST